MDIATIEACVQVARKVGNEYAYGNERVGAIAWTVGKAMRLLADHSLDEVLHTPGAMWANENDHTRINGEVN